MKTNYLPTDLDLRLSWFRPHPNGSYSASFETGTCFQKPDVSISTVLTIIESLSAPVRGL
ncbi:hypothetical protein BH09BAC4_BH09BAC4_31420 [soil metagenome]